MKSHEIAKGKEYEVVLITDEQKEIRFGLFYVMDGAVVVNTEPDQFQRLRHIAASGLETDWKKVTGIFGINLQLGESIEIRPADTGKMTRIECVDVVTFEAD